MPSVTSYYGHSYGPLPALEGGSTQAYKAGDLVKFSSGQLIIATAGAIDGIAAQDATGTQATATAYYPIMFDEIYVARYKAAATAQTLVGALVDFVFDLGAHTLDESGASTDAYVVALDPRDVVTTTSGRLLFRFMPAAGPAA